MTARRRRPAVAAALVAVLLALLLAGCTKDAPSDPSLDPAPVRREGAIGRSEDLFGVALVVTGITEFSQSPKGFPRLAVALRSQNTTLRPGRNPVVQLHCHEAAAGGDWYAGSTWEANGYLDPGEVDEGVIYVGFPAKTSNPSYSVARCTDAEVVVTATRDSDRARIIVSVPVPPPPIGKAIDQPRGPEMPLPPSVE
jgi:hypothetical protein